MNNGIHYILMYIFHFFLLYYLVLSEMVAINSNVSNYLCIRCTTLSGRPGGYPDDDLIKFKKIYKKYELQITM